MYFCTSLLLELVSKLKSGEGLIKGGMVAVNRQTQHHTSRPGRGRVGNHDPAMAGSRAPAVTQAPKRRAWAGSGALGLGWVSGVLRS